MTTGLPQRCALMIYGSSLMQGDLRVRSTKPSVDGARSGTHPAPCVHKSHLSVPHDTMLQNSGKHNFRNQSAEGKWIAERKASTHIKFTISRGPGSWHTPTGKIRNDK